MSEEKPSRHEEAKTALECAKTIVDAIPKTKKLGYFAEANTLFVFLEQIIRETRPEA